MKRQYVLSISLLVAVFLTVLAYADYSRWQQQQSSAFPTMTMIQFDVSDFQITPMGFVLLGVIALTVLLVLIRAIVQVRRRQYPTI